jgi:small subunit ribosomal protein S16
MAVKIRLQRKGRKKAPFYHIVIADARAPRDGRFIEKIGIYNPITKPATIELDREKAFEWLMKGAQPTDTTRAIMRYKGVLYRKHLSRGVQKGALTQEKADQMYQDWIANKEGSITQKVEARKKELADLHKKISGEMKDPATKPVSSEEE